MFRCFCPCSVDGSKNKTSNFPTGLSPHQLDIILPVATSSIEQTFSAMKFIKTDLRNRISDDWLNNLMVCYCEKRTFKGIPDDQIMIQFHKIKDLNGHLPCEYNVIS